MKKRTRRIRLDDIDVGDRIVIVTEIHDHIGQFRAVTRDRGRWFITIRHDDHALCSVPAKSIKQILSA